MQYERSYLDITFDIVILSLRVFPLIQGTPDSYNTKQQIHSYFYDNNAKNTAANFLSLLDRRLTKSDVISFIVKQKCPLN